MFQNLGVGCLIGKLIYLYKHRSGVVKFPVRKFAVLKSKVIQSVLALAEHQSFRIAAEQTKTTPASFSRYITQAEDYVGQELFERRGKMAFLTPIGQRFVGNLSPLVGAMKEFETGVEKLRAGGIETLRIGCGPLTTRTIIAPQLAALLEQAPHLRASIMVSATHEPLGALRNGDLDLTVCDLTYTADIPDLEVVVLAKRNISLWVRPGHPLLAEKDASLAMALQYPFISAYLPNYWRKLIAEAFFDGQKTVRHIDNFPQIQTDDFSLIAEMATRCDFVCAGMPEDFAPYCKLGTLQELNTGEKIPWNICIARRKGSGFPVLDLLWDRLIKQQRA